jgi:ferredoxin
MTAAISPGAQTVALSIDGRPLEARVGAYLLQLAREAGIEIPTLCDHAAVEPVGACRLCMVEVTHPDWNGWSGLVTACLYPAAEGIQVSTTSPRVQTARRQVLSLLAARCPRSTKVQELAAQHGADAQPLQVDPEADNCILCGLCTRVCEAWATSAITTWSRGSTKAVGPFLGRPPEECVGCGACAAICPTGHITSRRTETGYEIWERVFETAVCTVATHRCLACGACEEACPFSVPRVVLRRDGTRVAEIPAVHCRGCGACVGACPSGAIDQADPFSWRALRDATARAAGAIVVVACPRSGLEDQELPRGTSLLEVPCTGRVSAPLLLTLLAQGAPGVLVLGRHPETCRLGGAEAFGRERTLRASQLIDLLGMDPARVRFALSDPGPDGARRTVLDFVTRVRALQPTAAPAPGAADRPEDSVEGLDTGEAMACALSLGASSSPSAAAWLVEHGLPAAARGRPAVVAGPLPQLDLLGGMLFRPVWAHQVLHRALAVLQRLGVSGAGVTLSGWPTITEAQTEALRAASTLYVLSSEEESLLRGRGLSAQPLTQVLLHHGLELPRPTWPSRIACDDSSELPRLVEALGHQPVVVDRAPLPSRLVLSAAERKQVETYLACAEAAGASALLVPSVMALASLALVTRQGTWRSSRVAPLLAHELAWCSVAGTPPGRRTAWPDPAALEVAP